MKYISLFSGIEAASVAWVPLGWEAVAFAEIEPFPCQVLAHRFPNVPNLGDVTKVDWSKYRGKCDLIIGGSPCQSFSIAGLRKGLADPRGNLMLEYLRACNTVEPEWIIWENVPGVLSADNRRAFQTFLEAVVELWPSGGCAWRVMDAQFFGVAQRRRRVFAVVNTRDWRRAAAVLFEPGCLRGDNPSSREKRKELTRAAGFGAEGAGGGCLTPWDNESRRVFSQDGAFPTLYSGERSGGQQVSVLTAAHLEPVAPNSTVVCIQGSVIGRSDENGPQGGGLGDNVSFTLNTIDRHAVVYGFVGEHGGNTGLGVGAEQAPTVTAKHAPSVVAFAQNTRDELRIVNGDGQISGALSAQPGMKQTTYVMAREADEPNGGSVVCVADDTANAAIDEDLCGSLKVGGGCP